MNDKEFDELMKMVKDAITDYSYGVFTGMLKVLIELEKIEDKEERLKWLQEALEYTEKELNERKEDVEKGENN